MSAAGTVEPRVQRPGLERWAALGGILYVVLFIVGLIVAESGQPDGDAAPAKVIAYYSESSNRDQIALGWLLMLVGFVGLLFFVGVLAQVVRRLASEGFLARTVVVGGAIYAGAGVIGFSLSVALKTMSDDTYRHQVFPELVHAANDAAYVIHSGGGAGAAAMFIAASVAALRARVLPGWVCWLGVVAGIAAIFSVFFIPWIVIAVWIVAVSAMLFVSAGRSAAT
jgi:hypothetical protein